MIMKIAGRVRGMFAGNYAENREDEEFHINNRGDQCVVQALPERAELVRLGNSYISLASAATAPVAALPTTAAHFSLFNGESDDGLSYVVDYVGTYMATTAGAAINIGLCYCLNAGKQTSFVGTSTIKSLSGRANYRGKGGTKINVSITNDGWYPIGQTIVCANTANAMLSLEAPVNGRIIVPPGGQFSLATLCNAAAGTASPWIIWHEVRLILG